MDGDKLTLNISSKDTGTKYQYYIDKRLINAAEEMGKNERVQTEANHLINELARGNTNPGIGTRNLFTNIYYLRGKQGVRVIYRTTSDGIEILVKVSKANENTVIKVLEELYR